MWKMSVRFKDTRGRINSLWEPLDWWNHTVHDPRYMHDPQVGWDDFGMFAWRPRVYWEE